MNDDEFYKAAGVLKERMDAKIDINSFKKSTDEMK